jgi:hypothetical protein
MASLVSRPGIGHHAFVGKSIAQRVAHAATPWEWRSRSAVSVLLAVDVVLFVASLATGAFGATSGVGGMTIAAAAHGVLGYLLFLRPGVRSARRWNQLHDRHRLPTDA